MPTATYSCPHCRAVLDESHSELTQPARCPVCGKPVGTALPEAPSRQAEPADSASDRTISAPERLGPLDRLERWVRTHPAWAAIVGVALFIAACLPLVGVQRTVRVRSERRDTDKVAP